jgi:hypothetical protein
MERDMPASRRTLNAERVARRRAGLRAQGLRPRQFWLPDVRSEAFQAEVRRACAAIATSPGYAGDVAFAQALQYWPPDDS